MEDEKRKPAMINPDFEREIEDMIESTKSELQPARLWISLRQEYIDVRIPRACCTYSDDMEKEVECPWCGKKVKYGLTMTSKVFHTPLNGFGFAVCSDCYDWDWRFYAGKDRGLG